MEEKELQLHISGKAIYKAVKNLLENDMEFRTKVMEQVAKELADTDKIERMIAEQIKDIISSNVDLKQQITDHVHEIAEKHVPKIMRSKLDDIMKASILDMYRKLADKGKRQWLTKN